MAAEGGCIDFMFLPPPRLLDPLLIYRDCRCVQKKKILCGGKGTLPAPNTHTHTEITRKHSSRMHATHFCTFDTSGIYSITALIVYIELLLTPLTYPLISVSILFVQLYTH